MSSYDPSQWYSYSKNRPNDPPAKIIVDKRTKIIEEPVKSMPLSSPSVSEHVVEAEGKNPRGQEVAAASHSHSTKMNSFVKRLQKMARELPSCYKKKVTYDVITQLAESLLDDTVFEIVKGLEDIQQLSETNLLNRRMKALTEQKGQRLEMCKRHQSALQECQSRTHQLKLLEREHAEEKKVLDEKLSRELNQLDQKILLEIDQQVIDQQATLQRAGVPLFSITNKQEEVQLQMYLLDFITRLVPEKS